MGYVENVLLRLLKSKSKVPAQYVSLKPLQYSRGFLQYRWQIYIIEMLLLSGPRVIITCSVQKYQKKKYTTMSE